MSATASQLEAVLPASAPSILSDIHHDWRTAYPPEAWRRIRGEGIYLVCVLSFAVIVAAVLLRVNFANHEAVQRFLYCALGGIAGSWLFSMKWYVRAVTNHLWQHDLIAWRLASPFTGIFLSVSAYAVLKAGLLGVTFEANPSVDQKLYAYSVGFLVGLCSDVVMGKLTEVAETVFGKSAPRTPRPGKTS